MISVWCWRSDKGVILWLRNPWKWITLESTWKLNSHQYNFSLSGHPESCGISQSWISSFVAWLACSVSVAYLLETSMCLSCISLLMHQIALLREILMKLMTAFQVLNLKCFYSAAGTDGACWLVHAGIKPHLFLLLRNRPPLPIILSVSAQRIACFQHWAGSGHWPLSGQE